MVFIDLLSDLLPCLFKILFNNLHYGLLLFWSFNLKCYNDINFFRKVREQCYESFMGHNIAQRVKAHVSPLKSIHLSASNFALPHSLGLLECSFFSAVRIPNKSLAAVQMTIGAKLHMVEVL